MMRAAVCGSARSFAHPFFQEKNVMHRLISGLVVSFVLLIAGIVPAEEIKGKVKNVNAEKSTITITVDDKDKTMDLAKDIKVIGLVGKNLKKAKVQDILDGLTAVKEGADVTLTYETVAEKDTASQIRLEGLQAPKKKKKAN
jgi:hypothetical protein